MPPILQITILLSILFLLYHIVMYFFAPVQITNTPKSYYRELLKSNINFSGKNVYEFGSARADFLFFVEKQGAKNMVGYELSPLHVLYAKLKSKIIGSKVDIKMQDFFKSDIYDADIVYVFAVKKVAELCYKKMEKECKKGTVLIVLADRIRGENYSTKVATNINKKKTTHFFVYKVK